MKLPKLIAAVVLAATLNSCSKCEDVNLGKLEFTNELIAFTPPQLAEGKKYYATFDNQKHRMSYVRPDAYTQTTIPVRKKNYSGKFDLNSCKEYYTAEEMEYVGQIEGSAQYSFKLIYRKDADKQRFSDLNTKDSIEDILEIVVGYNNPFPKPVIHHNITYNSYTTLRHFYLRDAATTEMNGYTYVQEFKPTITLNGVEHEDVYHIYLTQTQSAYPEERYFNEQYPLDYVKGIYLKEGIGVIHAYTAAGKQVHITVE